MYISFIIMYCAYSSQQNEISSQLVLLTTFIDLYLKLRPQLSIPHQDFFVAGSDDTGLSISRSGQLLRDSR